MRNHLPIVGALLLAGCALLGKGEPLVWRYYSAEYEGEPAGAPGAPGPELRLGAVQAWPHLRERMVVRRADRELAYLEDRRWTERPEVYLRRALARALFEDRGVVEVVSGRAATLEVELTAFEEVLEPHLARLEARLSLRDDRLGLLEETFTVEQPVARAPGADRLHPVVEAFSVALRTAVARMADRVVARLSEPRLPEPGAR